MWKWKRNSDYGVDTIWPKQIGESDEPPRADLMFIHGLNGDPLRTWYAKGDNGMDVRWIEHFLPFDLEAPVRILTFKYNAKAVRYGSDANLEDLAESFLGHFQNERKSTRERYRPIILVCHSLGGLLAKQALVLPQTNAERIAIQRCTTGIVFLGTPHGGSLLGSGLRMAVLPDMPLKWNQILAVGSPMLKTLTDRFNIVYYDRLSTHEPSGPLRIASFCELDNTPIFSFAPFLKVQVVPIEYSKAGVRGEDVTKVHRHHRSLASFSSPDDKVYRMICAQISAWMNDLPDNAHLSRLVSSSSAQQLGGPNDILNDRKNWVKYVEVFRRQPAPFLGRQGDLQKIQNALTDPRENSVAIWGLGDIGKSSLAIKYAFIHEQDYRTVWLFECSTELAVKSSLERFFHYLETMHDSKLAEITTEAGMAEYEVVLFWAKAESQWLFIYDNYEPGYDLSKYFPDSRRGHRIVVSRSPEVGNFAFRKFELRELDLGIAVDVLLHHSGIEEDQLSPHLRKTAFEIVKLMEGMPGNIEAAGRLIRSFNLSLERYLSDLTNKVTNMQNASTRTDAGYLYASYHVTLDKLEGKTDDVSSVNAIALIRLFAVLYGHEISELLLGRARDSRLRWGRDGSIEEVSPEQDGVDGQILAILREDRSFDNAVKVLVDVGLIRRERSDMTIHVHQIVQDVVYGRLRETERVQWLQRGICFVGHAFPEEASIDGSFDFLRARLTNHVLRCLDLAEPLIKTADVDQLDDILDVFVSMLLSALGRSGNERWLMSLTERLVDRSNESYYRCLRAKWRAYMYYRDDDIDLAQQELRRAQAHEELLNEERRRPTNMRAHAALGDLIMHRAQFLIAKHELEKYEDVLHGWRPLTNSTMESCVHLGIKTAGARAMLARGKRENARELLEDIVTNTLIDPQGVDANRRSVNWAVVALCQVYCSYDTNDYFKKAKEQLVPRVDALIASSAQFGFIASDFRLLLCDIQLRQESYGHKMPSDACLKQIEALKEDLENPLAVSNPRRKIQLFDTECLLARFHHKRGKWEVALRHWKTCLNMMDLTDAMIDFFKLPEDPKYDVALCTLSFAVCLRHTGHKKDAGAYIDYLSSNLHCLLHPIETPDYTCWHQELSKDASVPPKLRYDAIKKVAKTLSLREPKSPQRLG